MWYHIQVRFSFWAEFFGDGFYGLRTETHAAKTNVEEAYEGCTAWICVCVDWDNEKLSIRVGSSVSTFPKTVTVNLLSLLAPEMEGSSEKYRLMRIDKYHTIQNSPTVVDEGFFN